MGEAANVRHQIEEEEKGVTFFWATRQVLGIEFRLAQHPASQMAAAPE